MLVNNQVANNLLKNDSDLIFKSVNPETEKTTSFIDSFSKLIEDKMLEDKVAKEEPPTKISNETNEYDKKNVNHKSDKNENSVSQNPENKVNEQNHDKKQENNESKSHSKESIKVDEIVEKQIKSEINNLKVEKNSEEDVIKNSVLINTLLGKVEKKSEGKGKNLKEKNIDIKGNSKQAILEKISIIDKRVNVKKENELQGENKIKAEFSKDGKKNNSQNLAVTNDNLNQMSLNDKNATAVIELKVANQGFSKNDIAQAIQKSGIKDIVSQTKILLKDNNQGEIKMVLRPEDLGTVKIKLFLENKFMVGKIYVENNIVKDAMLSNLNILKSELTNSGIEVSNLELIAMNSDSTSNFFGSSEDNSSSHEKGSMFYSSSDNQPGESKKEDFVNESTNQNFNMAV